MTGEPPHMGICGGFCKKQEKSAGSRPMAGKNGVKSILQGYRGNKELLAGLKRKE